MLLASVDVKESIKSMELMQDKQHETTALLVYVNNILLDKLVVVANGKSETYGDGETGVFLCEPQTFLPLKM